MSDSIKIFVGADRSQRLAVQALEHSIKATTSYPLQIESLEKLEIPEPVDVRQSQRTGFSFARWAVPELCQYKGRAIYLDADMLVFKDIATLWEVPMQDEAIAILDGRDSSYCSNAVKLNRNETSVMVINCEKATWRLAELVKGLDGKYTYAEMMSDLCFLEEKNIHRGISRSWNSMDYYDQTTNLVHFTNVPTQPWVSLENPFGYIWIDYLKNMLNQNALSMNEIQKEIDLGYVRPSLAVELGSEICRDPKSTYAEKLKKIDLKAKYVPHREVEEWNKKRKKAIQGYELSIAKNKGLLFYLNELMKSYIMEIKMQLKAILP